MNKELIETYIYIATEGSLSQAAKRLFVTQSTISSRLSQLENELGCKLLRRGQGIRGIELTEKGRNFLSIAEKWLELYNETKRLSGSSSRQSYRIVAPVSIAELVLSEICMEIMKSDDFPCFALRTASSLDIPGLVESRVADIGFAFFRPHFGNPGLQYREVRSEKMYIACNASHYPKKIFSVSELDPEKEVYMKWSEAITHWHNSIWDAEKALINTDSITYREALLSQFDCWSLCPESLAKKYKSNPNIRIFESDIPIPNRIYYMIHRNVKSSDYKKVLEEIVRRIKA